MAAGVVVGVLAWGRKSGSYNKKLLVSDFGGVRLAEFKRYVIDS